MNNPKKIATEIHFEVVVQLTRQDVEDLIVTALEGGIGYWACLDNRGEAYEKAPEDEPISITAAALVLDGPGIILIDEEEEESHVLTLEKLTKGIRLWIDNGDDRYGAMSHGKVDLCQIDAVMADLIIQYALFGDVLYG